MLRKTKTRISLLAFAVLLIVSAISLTFSQRAVTARAASSPGDFTVSTSSEINSAYYSTAYLNDGDITTSWLAAWVNVTRAECDEWVLMDFGEVRKVESVTIYRHKDGTSFPADFTFEWSVSGDVFAPIDGFAYTDYAPASGDFTGERFEISTVTRFVRIHVTKRSPNPEGYYVLGISELETEAFVASKAEIEEATRKDGELERRPVEDDPVISATATASSHNNAVDPDTQLPMWAESHINDGTVSTQWCAEWGSNVDKEDCDEWITLTFQSPQTVSGMIIRSQLLEHYGFPKSFSFAWSMDGEKFFDIEGATYADESIDDTVHVKVFSTPVTATAIRMNITSSYADSTGKFIPQLAELNAHGREATEAETEAATAAFNALVGNAANSAAKGVIKSGYAVEMALTLVFGIIFLLGAAAILALIILFGKRAAKTAEKQTESTVQKEEA